MAGDHKCPVCQATFTRPQHVARHMRSHTGDRPYKCQHCGDQFARSDLLSRHVNKCHASEKPPTTTAPTRRKGQHGLSSTRATTSKQACDQCVISTLPCDGCNPCSKCIQRKVGCTYIKFQRQTAPSGPGHKHNPSQDSVSSLAASIPRAEDLFLGPPPVNGSSIPPSDMYYSGGPVPHQQYNYLPPQSWDLLDSPTASPLTLSAAVDSGDSSSPDTAARLRIQTDIYRRAALGAPGSSLDPAIMSMYGNPHSNHPDLWPQGNGGDLSFQGPKHFDENGQAANDQFLYAQNPAPGPSGDFGAHQHQTGYDSFPGPNPDYYNVRRASLGHISDSSDASGCNSAASSSMHLPLDLGSQLGNHPNQHLQLPLDLDSYASFSESSQQPLQPPARDGRFSNAFGHLSLEEAAAFANFSDGAPFFSVDALKMPPQDSTPRPPLRDDEFAKNGSSRDRDGDLSMKDLREFWKQYMRTPSGPPTSTPKTENGNPGMSGRPSPKRGLSRVSSLPSVRTPSDEKGPIYQSRIPADDDYARSRPPHHQEDLKSYEQAVLARQPPVTLSIQPRKGRGSTASMSPGPQSAHPMDTCGSPSVPNINMATSPTVRKNSISQSHDDAGAAAIAAFEDGAFARPSFKRLPSQTLESANAKRAMFRWVDDPIEDTDSDADGLGVDGAFRMQFQQQNMYDRYRRGSAPTLPSRPTPV